MWYTVCTSHACWDITGYSDPFCPLIVSICGRWLKGKFVHKKSSHQGDVSLLKSATKDEKIIEHTGLLLSFQGAHSPSNY